MPTILWCGPYRLFFYSADGHEPMHVHVERDDKVAKFWLSPVRLETGGGFKAKELRRIAGMMESRQCELAGAWDEYFESRD